MTAVGWRKRGGSKPLSLISKESKMSTLNENSIKDLYMQIQWHQSGILTDYELLSFCKSLNLIEPENGYLDPATGLRYPFNTKK